MSKEGLSTVQHLQASSEISDETPTPCTYTVLITMLPYEVLGEIFLLISSPPIMSQFWHLKHPNIRYEKPGYENPIYLGHICRHLRGAAWSTPALWTYVNIYPTLSTTVWKGDGDENILPLEEWNDPYYWSYTEDSYFPRWDGEPVHPPVMPDETGPQLLQEWLERSKELPLTIVCRRELPQPSHVQWNQFTAGIFKVLVKVAHRWEHVDMFVPHICAKLLNAECESLGVLKTASLCAIGPMNTTKIDVEKDVNAAFILRHSPNLEKLQFCFWSSIYPVEQPFNHLTELRISDSTAESLLRLLNYTPHLGLVHLHNVKSVEGENLDDIHVDLKCMQSLTMISCSAFAILQHLRETPSLISFALTEVYKMKLDIYNICRFLRGSRCKLRKLTLRAELVHTASFNQLIPLACMESLTTLDITLNETDLADALATTLGRLLCLDYETNVPYLQRLEFHAAGGPFMRIIEAVKQRWRRGQFVSLGADNEPQSQHWLEGTGLTARIMFVGFRREITEINSQVKEHLKEEMEEGMVVLFKQVTMTYGKPSTYDKHLY